jgi:hypothetical protein
VNQINAPNNPAQNLDLVWHTGNVGIRLDVSEDMLFRTAAGSTFMYWDASEGHIRIGSVVGSFRFSSGSAANPGIAFDGDLDTGLFYEFGGATGWSSGGSQIVRFTSNALYATGTDGSSYTVRDILVGTGVPNNSWGKDGDIFVRHS